MNAPILELDACARLAADWRRQGLTVVFTNGHFDLLHAGHVSYLQAARAMGDRLIVGLNSDASTRRRKGPERPLIPQQERALLLAALRAVDAVIVWEQDDFREAVAALKPDIYVKGADWNRAGGPKPPEAGIVESYGGNVAYVELTPGRSTSAIVQDILRRHGCKPESGA
jgi:rfaE bifunctional protein nucleotidyltransferase chain/domain